MTEEELKKYTVDFMNKETSSDKSNLNSVIGKMLLRYAEVFQKRITELESTNKKISDECHKLVNSLEKKQKENADISR